MYFHKKWGKGMGLQNFISFGSTSYRKDRRIRCRKMFMMRLWIPWFPKSELPWNFDNMHFWIDIEPEDIQLG